MFLGDYDKPNTRYLWSVRNGCCINYILCPHQLCLYLYSVVWLIINWGVKKYRSIERSSSLHVHTIRRCAFPALFSHIGYTCINTIIKLIMSLRLEVAGDSENERCEKIAPWADSVDRITILKKWEKKLLCLSFVPFICYMAIKGTQLKPSSLLHFGNVRVFIIKKKIINYLISNIIKWKWSQARRSRNFDAASMDDLVTGDFLTPSLSMLTLE